MWGEKVKCRRKWRGSVLSRRMWKKSKWWSVMWADRESMKTKRRWEHFNTVLTRKTYSYFNYLAQSPNMRLEENCKRQFYLKEF